MSAKATHIGECQICGANQMLPNDLLSKHGYTVKWGFFSGVCAGAHGKPFEESTDLIARQMELVKADFAATEKEMATLFDGNSEINQGTKAWVSEYSSAIGYHWSQREIKGEARTGGDVSWMDFHYEVEESKYDHVARVKLPFIKLHRLQASNMNYAKTIRAAVLYLNHKYASQHLGSLQAKRNQWLSWQKERLKNWKAKPLKKRTDIND